MERTAQNRLGCAWPMFAPWVSRMDRSAASSRAGVASPSRKLWREIVAPLAEEELELTSRERQLLHSACRLTDRLTQLEAIMDAADPITEGYKGQPVPHPLLNEIRQRTN